MNSLQAVTMLLRRAFVIFEEKSTDPVKQLTEQAHGSVPTPGGAQLPQWIVTCKQYFTAAIAPNVNVVGTWDGYVLSEIIKRNLMRFAKLFAFDGNSELCEQLRDDAHHVGYIRQLAAHRGHPSAKEMVAGACAMRRVAEKLSIDLGQEFNHLLKLLQTVSQLTPGDTLNVKIPVEQLSVAYICAGFAAFEAVLNPEVCRMLTTKTQVSQPKDAKELCAVLSSKIKDKPFKQYAEKRGLLAAADLAAATKHAQERKHPLTNSIIQLGMMTPDQVLDARIALGEGAHHMLKKAWPEYRAWSYLEAHGYLETTLSARGTVFHQSTVVTDAEYGRQAVHSMRWIVSALGCDCTQLDSILAQFQLLIGQQVKLDVSGIADLTTLRIPFKVMDLVGRTDVMTEVSTLLATMQRQIVILRGEAGVGKTVTALAIANQLRESIQVQLMVPGSSRADFLRSMATFAHSHIQACSAETEEAVAANMALQFLEQLPSFLLLVDDAVDLSEIVSCLPQGSHGHVLITTKSRVACPAVTEHREIGVLTTAESMELLASITIRGKKIKSEVLGDQTIGLENVVQQSIGNLPIAVSLLGRLLVGLDVPAAAEALAHFEQSDLSELEYGSSDPRHLGLLGTVRVALQRLETNDEVARVVRQLMSSFSVLESVGAPLALFRGPGACIEPEELELGLELLDQAGLITVNEANDTATTHQLVQRCAVALLRQDSAALEAIDSLGAIVCDRFAKPAASTTASVRKKTSARKLLGTALVLLEKGCSLVPAAHTQRIADAVGKLHHGNQQDIQGDLVNRMIAAASRDRYCLRAALALAAGMQSAKQMEQVAAAME